jgi:CubicO group peptidase (beta-lactamase class C family)
MSLVPVLRDRVIAAGYRSDVPLVVGVLRPELPPAFHGQAGLTPQSLVYAASLAKQVTAACVALLARVGALNLDGPLSHWLPELPPWATNTVRIRHLVHHKGGLPFDVDPIGTDRTTANVLTALAGFAHLAHPPGTRFDYSNPGYVCLAEIVRRAADEPLQTFAHRMLFAPLGMHRTRFWSGPEPAPPGAMPLRPVHPAPLSLGDGGMWSTAEDLLRWCAGLNDDRLGLAAQLQTPGRLDDGTVLEYAWGMGVHEHSGYEVYRHGGAWAGLRALLIRVPDRGIGIVTLALDDDTERRIPLTDDLLDLLITPAYR